MNLEQMSVYVILTQDKIDNFHYIDPETTLNSKMLNRVVISKPSDVSFFPPLVDLHLLQLPLHQVGLGRGFRQLETQNSEEG